MPKKKKLFCERGRLFYAISVQKEIGKRHLKNLFTQERFATEIREQPLESPVAEQQSHMIKRAPGVELRLQENKAENIRIACRSIDGLIIHPGESFSFWKRVGKPSRRRGFRSGRVIRNNVLQPGVGGGLCNLGNTIHRMVLHSPLTVTEFHHHSDALAPDEGEREPLSAGTSISYNNVDYRFRNDTDQDVQLLLRCEGETLYGELRSEREFPVYYKLTEEDRHIQKEGNKYYQVSKICREIIDRATGERIGKELILDNHSEVMYDESLIPKELIRE